MTDELDRPSFFARIAIAFGAFFRALGNAEFAAGARALARGETLALPAEVEPEPEPEPEPEKPRIERAPTASALQLLALFQREGRFVDFLLEEVADFSDAEIGAAARVVHDGCRKALDEHVDLESIRAEDEGTKVTLEKGFDAQAIRLTGKVVGDPPFTGTLEHAGWRATRIELPALTEEHDVHVIAAAEVEL